MIQALGSALAGYSARSDDIARLAERIRNQSAGENVARDMVGLMVSQRAAEANLAVARVADETSESLIHVIA
jgi:flagellar basal body rod protein FlgG